MDLQIFDLLSFIESHISPSKMDLVGRNELGEFRQPMRKVPELRRYGSLLPAYDLFNRLLSVGREDYLRALLNQLC